MVANTMNQTGIGIYTPSEAAHYARVPTATMRRWVHGNRMGEPVINAQLPDDPEDRITFIDFIQTMAIRSIRTDYAVPLPRIRQAVQEAAKRYKIQHPLALKHRTYIFGSDIVIRLPGDQQDLIQISGGHRGQYMIKKVAELYMDRIVFEGDPKLATSFRAYEGFNRKIVMDPKQHFGHPALPCGYTARALFDAYITEGSIEDAAAAYGVAVEDVKAAVDYEHGIRVAAA